MVRIAGLAMLALSFGACSKTPPAAAQPPAAVTATPAQAAPAATTPPLANPLTVGSQAARDDLYCSAVIFAKFAPTSSALSPTDEAIRMRNEGMGMVIGQAGADKLMAEGAARVTQLGAIADAYSDQVDRDAKAGKVRLKSDECMKRAEALPKPQQ